MICSSAGRLSAAVPSSSLARDFERAVPDHYPRLFRFAYHLTRNRTQAEDLTQETLLRAYRRLDTFDSSRSFLPWLERIAYRLFLDSLRTQRGKREVSLEENEHILRLPDEHPEPFAQIMQGVLEERLECALRALAPPFRAAIILHDLEERSYEEIGEIMNCSLGTVRSRIHRGRTQMRRFLEQA